MRRSGHGLLLSLAFAAGCASAAPPEEVQAQSGGDGDMSGGVVVQNCTDGGSCDTGNPGDCSMGHTVCSGDVQSCVPDVTTQRCYDGPANTVNVGICAAGMQTCIGAAGTCQGEVQPAAQENCFNDTDDDCNGVVNNGCPDHLVTGTPRVLTVHGNTGGSAFSLRCPAGAFVIKPVVYADESDEFVGGIDITCATPTLVRGTSSYRVNATAVAVSASTMHATKITVGDSYTFNCGTTGFTPGWWSAEPAELAASTRRHALRAMDPFRWRPTISFRDDDQEAGTINYFGYPNFGTQFEDDCTANEVVIGYDGSYGDFFDSIKAVCAPLQVVYK